MKSFSRKERTRSALLRQPVDRLPTQINYTPKMRAILASTLDVEEAALDETLDNHLLRLDLSFPKRLSEDGSTSFDWWGAGWDTRTEGYWHSFAPLGKSDDLDAYGWPDPDAPGLLDGAAEVMRGRGRDFFVTPNSGMLLFERAWSLRGFDSMLMDMVERTEWVEDLLDRITAIQLRLVERFIALGVDGGYFGDDYGAQKSMLFSPRLWRRLMKPRLARLFAPFRAAGLPVILHSDGDIRAILPDLVEIGLTTLNPVQPEVLEHGWLYREYGSHLSFYGGISTQGVLPSGSPAEVREATLTCASVLAPEGTGLLLGPSHRMQSDIPPANVLAMLQGFPRSTQALSTGDCHRYSGPPYYRERRDGVEEAFGGRFEGAPSIWTRAPGRVDLMGSHTDYNLGYVLTLPISRDTWVAARPRPDRVVRVHSLNTGSTIEFSLDAIEQSRGHDWGDYVRGVAAALAGARLPLSGMNAVIDSTVPLCSGLSSSAALECAMAVTFQQMGGWPWDPVEMAKLCQKAENEFVGLNCGILDQFTSCAGVEGCALLLDCRDLSSRPVQIDPSIRIVICDTRSKRELVGSEYGQRHAQCDEGARLLGVSHLRDATLEMVDAANLPPEVAKRCRFIVAESERCAALACALAGGDRAAIRSLTRDSFAGASELYEIASPPMHDMMNAMLAAPGVIGARQAGAGFGGCMVAFVEAGAATEFAGAVRSAYSTATGVSPEIYPVEAAPGAGPIGDIDAA